MPGSHGNPYAQESLPPLTLDERNRMVEDNLPLVKFVASRIAGRLPPHVELDDLINAGVIGLIDAIEKFDPNRQIKFKTYAEFRVKGAILDELRALDWVPRSTRQKASRIERAFSEMEQKLGRLATDDEMVEHLGITHEEYDEMLAEARGIRLVSLDELHAENDENSERNLLEFLTNPDYIDPAEVLNLEQVYAIVADSIDNLPEKEKLVVTLYYHEELTMKEIGEVLDITESRISQIHTKAILRLRGRLLKTVVL
ncbi:TPA: FliA/WhiG family RNA polymerase sigma factor [Candidatus Sumerlaeota bacterium]|jgi:RNA polymerase sigma factor FliA|nr:FliA/WhiG family RNA polymerase sigma factor [Candidatus Sumerlaeota bacterium]